MLKKVLLISVFGLASSLAMPSFAEDAATADTAKAAIEAATTAQKAAKAAGGEWRDIGKMLKAAAKAAEDGDFAKAVSTAKSAEEQSNIGKAQMEKQQGLELPSYFSS